MFHLLGRFASGSPSSDILLRLAAMSAKRNVASVEPEQNGRHDDDLLREVSRICVERGLRLTPLRADVLRLDSQASRPLKAYDVLDRIRESTAKSAPVTAYRSLDFLVEHGFIHKLESTSTYVPCRHPGSRHAVPFLICDNCQLVIEMDDERTARTLDERALEQGFAAMSQTLEVHGLCKDCRSIAHGISHAHRPDFGHDSA